MFKRLVMLFLGVTVLSLMSYGAEDALVGTWKLNLAKSKFNSAPAPQSQTNTYESVGDNGVKLTLDSVDAQGKPGHNTNTATYDGKEYAVGNGTNASGHKTTMSLKRIDAYTSVRTNLVDGKALSTETRVVSKDGKTLTITQTGVDAQGKKVDLFRYFDRQ